MRGPEDRPPLVRELDDPAPPAPQEAAPVDGDDLRPAMARAAMQLSRRKSRVSRAFWWVFSALFTLILSLAAWNWVTGLIARIPFLGVVAAVLTGALALLALVIAVRELAGFLRIRRLTDLHSRAESTLAGNDLALAREVAEDILRLYAPREELATACNEVRRHLPEAMDVEAVFTPLETTVLAPLDRMAAREIEAAARQVALLTAIVPLALLDVLAVLWINLRMVRALAQLYGGRAGLAGSWRLVRAVLVHLAAAGALAMGDDLFTQLAGGSVLSKLSRRFGEGAANGALTVRAGIAAMEVCRPLPFRARPRPGVAVLAGRALKGLFDSVQ